MTDVGGGGSAGDGPKPGFRGYLASLANAGESPWRFIVAAAVIGLTFWQTLENVTIPTEWDAIFLLVIGYYFKDRPEDERKTRAMISNYLAKVSRSAKEILAEQSARVSARGEMVFQFGLAALLIAGAAICFLRKGANGAIPAGWIGGVLLAVGFYFQKGSDSNDDVERETFRRILVLVLIAVTILVGAYGWNSAERAFPLPTQWIAVILLVVGFYFKENAAAKKKP